MRQYKLSLIQAPSGRWVFVGSVPHKLAFGGPQGEALDALYIERELRLPSNRRKIHTRSWNTELEARCEAERLGFKV